MMIKDLIVYHENKKQMHKERYLQLVKNRKHSCDENYLFWVRIRLHDIRQYRFHRDVIKLLNRLQED